VGDASRLGTRVGVAVAGGAVGVGVAVGTGVELGRGVGVAVGVGELVGSSMDAPSPTNVGQPPQRSVTVNGTVEASPSWTALMWNVVVWLLTGTLMPPVTPVKPLMSMRAFVAWLNWITEMVLLGMAVVCVVRTNMFPVGRNCESFSIVISTGGRGAHPDPLAAGVAVGGREAGPAPTKVGQPPQRSVR
jgi:hypothetical protein